MFVLTSTERAALLCLSVILIAGAVLKFVLARNPAWQNNIPLNDHQRALWQINVNSADRDQLLSVPYIGQYTADQILRYRQQKGRIENVEELRTLPGIHQKSYDIFSAYLKAGS